MLGVQNYIAALKRVEQRLAKLKSTNFRVNQEVMTESSKLLNYGRQQLQELFESMIQDETKIIEPLNFITKRISIG